MPMLAHSERSSAEISWPANCRCLQGLGLERDEECSERRFGGRRSSSDDLVLMRCASVNRDMFASTIHGSGRYIRNKGRFVEIGIRRYCCDPEKHRKMKYLGLTYAGLPVNNNYKQTAMQAMQFINESIQVCVLSNIANCRPILCSPFSRLAILRR